MSSDLGADNVIVRACGLVKHYERDTVVALDGLDLDVREGEFVAICGPSGCGKSTLLNMVSGVDRPDEGDVIVAGRRLAGLNSTELACFRRDVVGLVFQLHNLIPSLTALENVQAPMLGGRLRGAERVERARGLLRDVGLEGRENAAPPTLSGGERQRVAVARALANRPRVILADEPTGSLDSRNGERLCELLGDVRRDTGAALVVVTHDPQVAERAQRVVHMLDGRVVSPESGAGGGPVEASTAAR